jgi:hypothetical protein
MADTFANVSHACLATLAVAAAFAGCGSSTPPGGTAKTTGSDGGGSDGGPTFIVSGDGGTADAGTPQCITATGQCVDTTCAGGAATTISGVVYDPAGNDPLYGIVAYVPSTATGPITTGASCAACNSFYSGNPIAYAVTDADGKFTITGVPDGANIPLVIQVGKWRMQYVIPSVTKCIDNDAALLLNTTLKLPNNHTVGDIPSIAISTGAADSLECLLVRIGVDESEYGGGPSGSGRIHIFTTNNPDSGAGADTSPDTNVAAQTSSTSLWATDAQIMPYDIVLLGCEGYDTYNPVPQTLFDYATNGGRVFASHFHYAWFTDDPSTNPFITINGAAAGSTDAGVSTPLANWATGAQLFGSNVVDGIVQQTLPGGGAFPRGVAMYQFLQNTNALVSAANGLELQMTGSRHNANVTSSNPLSVPWIVADSNSPTTYPTQYFSFDMPFGSTATEQCGRIVYSDLHVGAASNDYGGYGDPTYGLIDQPAIVPGGCTKGMLSPQEKALEFMLFDLSGCVTPDSQGAGGMITPPPQ